MYIPTESITLCQWRKSRYKVYIYSVHTVYIPIFPIPTYLSIFSRSGISIDSIDREKEIEIEIERADRLTDRLTDRPTDRPSGAEGMVWCVVGMENRYIHTYIQ